MSIQDVDVAVKLMTAVMEGFALMEIDDDDFDSLFHAIKYHADNRMPIGRIQFEYVFLNDENRLRVGFALSPMILCSAKAKYRGINTVKWFINLPNMDIDFSETTVPSFLAKSQVGLIETPNYDFEDLAQFMDEKDCHSLIKCRFKRQPHEPTGNSGFFFAQKTNLVVITASI